MLKKNTGGKPYKIDKDYSASVLYSDIVLCILSFVTFLSFEVSFGGIGNLRLPSEAILLLLCLVFAFLLLGQGKIKTDLGLSVKKRELFSNLPLWIGLYIVWIWISSAFSTLPFIALKSSAALTWCVIPGFYLVYKIERENAKAFWGQKILFWALMGLCAVSLYGVIRFYTLENLPISRIFLLPKPFLSDHTHWGALISLFIFVALYLSLYGKAKGMKLFSLLAFVVLIFALWVCRSRAAVVSLFPALLIGALIYIWQQPKKKRFVYLFSGLVFLGVAGGAVLWKAQNASGKSMNWSANMLSLANFKEDSSSMERINRWSCAYKMTEDNPVVGCGKGVYQFVYGPYQRKEDMTKDSSVIGDRGNAHSEYLSAFAESGIIGGLLFICMVVTAFVTGSKAYRKYAKWESDIKNSKEERAEAKAQKMFVLALILGLITYFSHSLFNNFLYLDSSCFMVFVFFALLAAANKRASF